MNVALSRLSLAAGTQTSMLGISVTPSVFLPPNLPPVLNTAVQAPSQLCGTSFPLPGGAPKGGPPGCLGGAGGFAGGGGSGWVPPQSSAQSGSKWGITGNTLGFGESGSESSGGPMRPRRPVGPAGHEGSGVGIFLCGGNSAFLPQDSLLSEFAVKQVQDTHVLIPCDTALVCGNVESHNFCCVDPPEIDTLEEVGISLEFVIEEVNVSMEPSVAFGADAVIHKDLRECDILEESCVVDEARGLLKPSCNMETREISIAPCVFSLSSILGSEKLSLVIEKFSCLADLTLFATAKAATVLMCVSAAANNSSLLLIMAASLDFVGGTGKIAFATCCSLQNVRRGVG
jgi:hypothetical protein